MPDDAEDADDLDVRLDWPSGVVEEPGGPPPLTPSPAGGVTAPSETPRGLLPKLADDLGSLRQHIETMHEDIAGMVARVHALGAAVTGVEVAIADRLAEYADTVVQLGRGLTSNLSTYREGNDRTVADLRRALADSDELVRSVLQKTDDLAVAVGALRSGPAGVEADDDAIDVDDLRAVVQDAVAAFDVRSDVSQLASELASVGERLDALVAEAIIEPSAPSGIDGAMHAEILTALETMRTEFRQSAPATPRSPRASVDLEQERAIVSELQAIREEIAAVKRRIAVRAKAPTIDDEQIAQIVEQVSAAVALRLPDDELDRVAGLVAQRIADTFEVVSDEDSAFAAPEPEPPPSSKTSSRRR